MAGETLGPRHLYYSLPDPGQDRALALAAGRGEVEVADEPADRLPAHEIGKVEPDPALPVAHVQLAEAGLLADRKPVGPRDDLRRLHRAAEIARVDNGERLARKPGRDGGVDSGRKRQGD